ncbi:MAG: PmoA family protein [Balneolaceae bacterium]|nr:PmoA family protein [Balneolaceae bacterium]
MLVRFVNVWVGLLLLLLVPTAFIQAQPAQEYRITASAGNFDRIESIASFTFPQVVEPGIYTIEDGSGQETALQVDQQNRGWFVIERLQAGTSKTYTLNTSSQHPGNSNQGISLTEEENTLQFNSGGDEVLSFYHKQNNLPKGMDEVYRRGGYIHPVYSPNGTQLTNHLDTTVHTHHYGIWAAWTSTQFQGRTPDFWNIQDKTAEVARGDSVDLKWEGPVHGGIVTKNFHVDISAPAPVVALNEEWEVRIFQNSADYHLFDVTLTHSANTLHPLILPQYHYGGMAFRGHQQWNDPANVTFLTSEGHGRDSANETRARWSHMGGVVDGATAGIAVLGHPENYRAPQPIRIHPQTPYFTYAPMQLGNMVIEPGDPYIMQYRYVTYDGDPDPELLNRLWNDYAYPPGITVEAL